MEQNRVYTVSIHPIGLERRLLHTPSSIVFSSRSKAHDFKMEADKLIRESGRNFYTVLQETTMDCMEYRKNLRDELKDLNHEFRGIWENMIYTVVVDNKLDHDAPPYVFLFSSYTKAMEFARDIDKTIEMTDASNRYKVFVDSAYMDSTDSINWLYDDLDGRISAKAEEIVRAWKNKRN